ncbi:MAG: sugar phosphate isomerase/epimerase [Oscillospiraceae bacterium]|nr:sugar phosphate isomerase/epimerase [Oscillospiraceae bacterium]MDD4414520.1 sugar phosphate isomerase/epimerase [Oscillospiraceae bacterium]
MHRFPIGVLLDSFRTDIKTALKKAKDLEIQGIQVYATSGELSPDNLTGEKKREFLDMVISHGLTISALCGDLGHGFGDPEKNPQLIERSKRIIDLAKDLNTDIVTTHIGVIPDNPAHERYKIMQEACGQLSEYADSINAHFAIETGPETAVILKDFLDSLGSKGVAVNLDPANFVMVTGDDPVKAVYTLKDYIVHTHAKDGRKLKECNPEVIYGIIETAIKQANAFIELPLGKGDVDFPNYIKALEDIGYNGYLTIEREVGQNPEDDIKLAVEFLESLINEGRNYG